MFRRGAQRHTPAAPRSGVWPGLRDPSVSADVLLNEFGQPIRHGGNWLFATFSAADPRGRRTSSRAMSGPGSAALYLNAQMSPGRGLGDGAQGRRRACRARRRLLHQAGDRRRPVRLRRVAGHQ